MTTAGADVQVTDLAVDDHACLTFGEPEDLFDVLLRICRQYAPPGIRVAGELDYRRQEPLALALAEAIRLDGDITVNLAGLTFIDGPCARMILDAARGLAGSGRSWCGATRRSPGPSSCSGRAGWPGSAW